MITHTQIKYILSLNEHKNFQRAAESCFVTQPTLSMQIKKAEDLLGELVFDRDYSPVQLTSFGRTIFPLLHAIQAGFDELEVEIQKSRGTYKAVIRVGIIPTVAEYLIPQMYAKWREELQDIRLEIHELKSERLIEELENRTIDFGIMAGPYEKDDLAQQILYNEEILIYVPQIENTVVSLEEISELKPWLLSEGNCLRTQMVNFCNLKEDSKGDWNYEGGSMSLLLKMVNQEGGYTLVPHNFVSLLNVNLKHLKRIESNVAARQIIGLFHKRSSKSKGINALIRSIQHEKSGELKGNANKFEILPWK
jgi:LysR family transcriptional regulator, hydrogen peroxide-inducible genes activator